MLKPRSRFVFLAATFATLLLATVRTNRAGEEPFRDPLTGKSASGKRADVPSKPTHLKVSLAEEKAGEIFLLSISLKIPPGGYTYSTDPLFDGGTRIKLIEAGGLEPVDDKFSSDHAPKIEYQAVFGQNVEKFKDAVTWTRRFRMKADAKRSDVRIISQVRFQICDSLNCKSFNEAFVVHADGAAEVIDSTAPATLAAFISRVAPPATAEIPTVDPKPESVAAEQIETKPFELMIVPKSGKSSDPIALRFRLSPENAQPGESTLLSITMELDSDWHTFALDQNPENTGLPTQIEITAPHGLKLAEKTFSPSLAPETVRASSGKEQRVHHKQITWTMPLTVEQANYGVSGTITYQLCREKNCRFPNTVAFELGHVIKAVVIDKPEKTETVVLIPPPTTDDDGAPNLDGQEFMPRKQTGSLALYLVYAFLGGLILNVMPCVLPVIAIKVLSFVQQSGQSRGRILLLNLTYSLGVLTVFLVLAGFAVAAKVGLIKQFGWGSFFQETEFQVVMSCIVFAMGLSLLGVFEIPIPGMVGSAASQQHQEGPLGAFLTGIFATLLATPCSGPFLGVTLGWSVQQEPHIIFLVWAVMGLGMGAPYILLGFFPAWVKYLPKPGNWMVTFKEVCGFILMGTIIFLMSSMKGHWQLPLLILLLSIGFSLWMIGKLYTINSPASRRWTVRGFATLVSGVGLWLAIGLADDKPGAYELPWQPFSGKLVKSELRQRRTVLLDFTANWCAACKVNELIAFNRKETLERIQKHNIVAVKADYTEFSPKIKEWLDEFESASIPLAIIFPGNDPLHPIVLRDSITQGQLLEKLDEAVQVKSDNQRKLTLR
ncbi:MAG: protein-disulfide reductase DsbD family protein [Planctomycetaceae bacterium]